MFRKFAQFMATKIAQAAFHGTNKAISQGIVRLQILWRIGGGGVKWPVFAQGCNDKIDRPPGFLSVALGE